MLNEDFRNMFDHAPFGIYRSTPDGRLLEANPALAHMCGYESPAEMMALVSDLASQVFEDPLERVSIIDRAMASDDFVRSEIRLRRKDGVQINAVLQMKARRGMGNTEDILEGFLQDVTSERTTERRLSQTDDLNALLVKAIPFGISIVDCTGEILFCNDEMTHLAGSNVTGKQCWEVYKDSRSKCIDCPLGEGLLPGRIFTTEAVNAFGGRTFQVTHAGLMFNGKQAVLEIFEDITEKKKFQAELAQAQKLESIGTLASGIAHDFNNLLGIILGNLSLIDVPADENDNTGMRVRTIMRAAERGAALVRQMLTFARKSEPTFVPVSVNRIVDDLVKLLNETFPKSVRILCNLTEDLPKVNGDMTQIHQVLLNLCVNARDAMTQPGDLIISTEAVDVQTVHRLFPTASAPGYVLVGVSDNGSGMSREVLEHIFEPFYTTKGPGKGTGLGLSVVFGIMEDHHGFINVASEPGKGTDFSLYFPFYPEKVESLDEDEVMDFDAPGGDETILVVEDEEMLIELATTILTEKGYNVIGASDGKAAVDIYRRQAHEIDLVISDLGLPKLSGAEVLTWLKEINPKVKFILATGYINPEERAAIIENGAKEVVLKPYRPSELLKKVRRVLDL